MEQRKPHKRKPVRTTTSQKAPWLYILGCIVVLLVAVFAVRACAGSADQASPGTTPNASGSETSQTDGSVVLTIFGDPNTVVLKGEEYLEPGAQAIDKSAGQISERITIDGKVDTSKPGEYQVTYRVTGDSGAQATRTRTVTVVDTMDKDADGIPVMMYHYVYDPADPPEDDNTNNLSADKLEAQLQWLKDEGYYFPSFRELVAYIEGKHSLPAKSVILTFDDAEDGFLEYGVPLFEKYQIPATSYIIGDRPETPDKLRTYANEYVSFQSHSYGLHNDGSSGIGHGGIIYDKTHEQLVEDEKKMNEMLGPHQSMAYPYGDYNDDAERALSEAGDICAFTTHYGNAKRGDNPMELSRVRVFGEGELEGFKYQVKTGE